MKTGEKSLGFVGRSPKRLFPYCFDGVQYLPVSGNGFGGIVMRWLEGKGETIAYFQYPRRADSFETDEASECAT